MEFSCSTLRIYNRQTDRQLQLMNCKRRRGLLLVDDVLCECVCVCVCVGSNPDAAPRFVLSSVAIHQGQWCIEMYNRRFLLTDFHVGVALYRGFALCVCVCVCVCL